MKSIDQISTPEFHHFVDNNTDKKLTLYTYIFLIEQQKTLMNEVNNK